tara:strand:+ start:581 stop:1840 length:1260 start_codon:yes stop_codon:yes gene_type:complete
MKQLAQSLGMLFLVSCLNSEIVDPISLEVPPKQEPSGNSSINLNGKTLCENGMAGVYPCLGYDLLSRISLEELGSLSGNDNWGWTDPETGKEYLISGLDDGTAFIDISNPEEPFFLGKLLTATEISIWRDVKVFKNHAFIVSEATDHGMQIFDLTRLRDVFSVQNFTADARLTYFGNAHNISINETSGFAYVIGSNRFQGGPIFIDINDPKNPNVIGGYAEASYTHDAQIVNYQGPDVTFQGKELFFGSNSDGGDNNQVVIIDVTDKTAPQLVNSFSYENGGYTHQGYLSDDHQYFFLGDELDELRFGAPTLTRIFDISNLMNPQLHLNYFAGVYAIDHNGFVKGNNFFLASYTAGLRVLDIGEIDAKKVSEARFFDTYPENNNASFEGVWSVYPFFESGVIALNDINSGVFLVKASEK